MSPVLVIQCKEWMKWMKSLTQERETKNKEDEPFQINQVIKKIQDAEDNKDTVDMTNIREEVSNKLTRYNTKPTTCLSSIKYFKDGNNEEKACFKDRNNKEGKEKTSKENSSQIIP